MLKPNSTSAKIFKSITAIAVVALFIPGCNLKSQNNNAATPTVDSPKVVQEEAPSIELVFCLDATGSMSGLIHTAKEKIWDIVTVMSQSTPSPDIKLGMVFYRDLQDAFVTKTYPLTNDIDSIYSELLLIEAQGGGDSPKSVNQALNEAVNLMGWSQDPKVYRTIFLVGDCPPHMDYQEVRYPEISEQASQQGIVINTIKLGIACTDAIPHFKSIAKITNGEYKQLGQHANDIVIETPLDDSISYYSNQIDASKLYYGSAKEKEEMQRKKGKAMELYESSSSSAVASRAKFNMSKAGKKNLYGKKELVEEVMNNEIILDDIEEDELPDLMKSMNKEEQKAHLKKLQKERATNIARLTKLSKEREAYIAKEMAQDSSRASFSQEIYKVVKTQAASKGVKIAE